ncbi:hypothetical protein BaRGS_00027232, partial [Batillaria attramentaria]
MQEASQVEGSGDCLEDRIPPLQAVVAANWTTWAPVLWSRSRIFSKASFSPHLLLSLGHLIIWANFILRVSRAVTNCPLDVMFLLDGSDSIPPLAFQKAQQYVVKQIRSLRAAFQGVDVGVLLFSDGVSEELPLQQRTQTEIDTLQRDILALRQPRRNTELTGTLRRARRALVDYGGEPLVPGGHRGKVIVLLSDGCADENGEVRREGLLATVDGIYIISVHVSGGSTQFMKVLTDLSVQVLEMRTDIDWNSVAACPGRVRLAPQERDGFGKDVPVPLDSVVQSAFLTLKRLFGLHFRVEQIHVRFRVSSTPQTFRCAKIRVPVRHSCSRGRAREAWPLEQECQFDAMPRPKRNYMLGPLLWFYGVFPQEIIIPAAYLCSNVVFAMDGSDSVKRWKGVMRDYLAYTTMRFEYVQNAIGVIVFGTNVAQQSTDTMLPPTEDKAWLAYQIETHLRFPESGGTGTTAAIQTAVAMLNTLDAGDRNTIALASAVAGGYQVVVVGVGEVVSRDELQRLAGPGSTVLQVESYLDLFALDLEEKTSVAHAPVQMVDSRTPIHAFARVHHPTLASSVRSAVHLRQQTALQDRSLTKRHALVQELVPCLVVKMVALSTVTPVVALVHLVSQALTVEQEFVPCLVVKMAALSTVSPAPAVVQIVLQELIVEQDLVPCLVVKMVALSTVTPVVALVHLVSQALTVEQELVPCLVVKMVALSTVTPVVALVHLVSQALTVEQDLVPCLVVKMVALSTVTPVVAVVHLVSQALTVEGETSVAHAPVQMVDSRTPIHAFARVHHPTLASSVRSAVHLRQQTALRDRSLTKQHALV